MTDKDTLFLYRLKQADETLYDAELMLQNKLSPRSITNRAYYTMFYAVLALFLRKDIHVKTSKHIGVISLFDREFIHTNRIEKKYSKMLHKIFNVRLKGDYKELIEISTEEAEEHIKLAREFLQNIKAYTEKN
ncbi:MAG: HEPN domain-containing protein [Candidatus Scalindua sp.]